MVVLVCLPCVISSMTITTDVNTVHHCPICQTPLTHSNARSRCLGEHVEWCGRYHTQLFRIGEIQTSPPLQGFY